MTIETLDPKYCVDFTSTQQVDFAVMENDFTAGYTLKNQDGINNIRDTWEVNFSMLEYADMSDLWDFLETKKGYIAFFWTPPRDDNPSPRLWACLKLSRTMESSNSWTISAIFQESFTHFPGQISTFRMLGVAGTGHAGVITNNLAFAPGTAGVSGIEAVGSAGAVFPSQIYGYGDQFGSAQVVESASYRTAVYAPDGYIYIWRERKYLVKVDPTTFQQVDIYDMDANASSAGVHNSIGGGHASIKYYPMCADATYLYWATGSGKLTRVALSDFRTSDTFDLTGADADLGVPTAMAIYSGNMYLVFGSLSNSSGTGVAKAAKLDLSNFSSGGVSVLDFSSLTSGTEYLKKARSATIADHYLFITFEDAHKVMRIDLSISWVIGSILMQTITGDSISTNHSGKAAYDGGSYIYYGCSVGTNTLARVNLNNTTYDRVSLNNLPTGPNAFGNTWTSAGVILNGNDLWAVTSPFTAGAGMAVKLDVTTWGAANTHTYFDIISMNMGDSPDGGPMFREFPNSGGYLVDQGYFDLCTDGTWLYATPNTTTYDISYNLGMLHRVQLNQTHSNFRTSDPPEWFNPAPPSSGYVEDPWNGGDNAPSTSQTFVDMPGWLFNAVQAGTNRKWIATFMFKFTSAGGKVTAWDVGGNAGVMQVERTNGQIYTGIWMMDNPSVLGSFDMSITTDTPIEYFEFQGYVYDGLPKHCQVDIANGAATGDTITVPFSIDPDELGIFAVTLDQAWNESNFTHSDTGNGNWSEEDYDIWGPEVAYSGDTVAMWVGVNDNTGGTADSGNFTFEWASDTVGSVPYAYCYAAFKQISTDPPDPSPSKYVHGVWAVGYPGLVFPSN